MSALESKSLIDPFGREVTYVRISVTDRCDLRCVYCMAENMTFLPKKDLLSLEELERLCDVFISRGVKKIRLTGGEPLVRKNILFLIEKLGQKTRAGELDEVTLTTNGTQLKRFSKDLSELGVKRINVSLDTRNPEKFNKITRWGNLDLVLEGIESALDAGLKVKINMVALKSENESEIVDMLQWCHSKGMDLTLIETMPMGAIDENRFDQYLSLASVREKLEEQWTLEDIPFRTGGPARYVNVVETGGKLGFITPMSHNFCESCNRVRVTCTGTLYMCLGQDDAADLKTPLRKSTDNELVDQTLVDAISRKPKGHDFQIDRVSTTNTKRHMSVTGG